MFCLNTEVIQSRSESDASTASADQAGNDSKKSKEDNTLLDTITRINGDLKTSDKGSSEHSSGKILQ